YRVSSRLSVSSAFQAASGLPATLPSGARVAAGVPFTLPQGGMRRDPLTTLNGFIYELDYGPMTRLNATRLPATSRLDLRATWRPKDQKGRWTLYLDVINVLNHRN